MTVETDVAVVGGGPAGAAAARVLAAKGHRVILVTRASDRAHERAESLPPSTRRLFERLGLLETVSAAGFLPNTGNTVWWGDREGDAEPFGGLAEPATGYQVFRPDLDRLLTEGAAATGACVMSGVSVARVDMDGAGAQLTCARDSGDRVTVRARFLVDASGRAGLVARQGLRRPQNGFAAQALIGSWECADGWRDCDPRHTIVETCDDGWAYSVPLSPTRRHIGVLVDGVRSRVSAEPDVVRKYLAALAKMRHLAALVADSRIVRAWACAASMYESTTYARDRFVLVGDAASFVEPLSSFGVKKALASSWLGAIAVHTALTHPERRADAFEFFSSVEHRVYASSLARSCAYAREAFERHPSPFWAARATVTPPAVASFIDDRALLETPEVRDAFERLKSDDVQGFARSARDSTSRAAFVRNDEVVVDEAIRLPGVPQAVRFLGDVDLVALRNVACTSSQVGDVVDGYLRSYRGARLPHVLGALSVLVAKGVLVPLPRPVPSLASPGSRAGVALGHEV